MLSRQTSIQPAEETLADDHLGGKRAKRRRRVLLAGKLSFGMAITDCTIRDLNAVGARVHAPAVMGLPDEVMLLILREGLLVRARRIWTRQPQFGLEFIEAEDIQTSRKAQSVPLLKAWHGWVAQHHG